MKYKVTVRFTDGSSTPFRLEGLDELSALVDWALKEPKFQRYEVTGIRGEQAITSEARRRELDATYTILRRCLRYS